MTTFGKSNKSQAGVLASTGLTPQTQKLLEDSMRQRGLSLRAMQDVATNVQGGGAGWVDALLNRTATFSPAASKAHPVTKVPSYKKGPHRGPSIPAVPASFSGKRMLTQIGTPEREQYQGGPPAPNRDLLKDELAQAMEFGSAAAARKHEAQRAAALEAAQRAAAAARPVDVKEALIEQLVQEIAERTEFLDTMKAAGRHHEYDAQIRAEISQRMAKLKSLGVDVSAGQPQRPRPPAVVAPWQKKTEKVPARQGATQHCTGVADTMQLRQ